MAHARSAWLSLRRVALLAVIIRLAHLAVLIALDQLLEDYDTSAHLHSSDARGHGQTNHKDHLFGSLLVWDSVFFAEIARRGYEYEQYYAFFPLLPSLSSLLGPAWIPIMAHAVSLTCSVLTAVLFAKLSSHVLQQPSAAATATLLLLLGQACVFHTAAYTESLFSALTMAGLYCLYCMGQPSSTSATPPAHTLPPSSSSHSRPTPNSRSGRPGGQGTGPAPSSPSPSRPTLTPRSLMAACAAFTLASCTRSNGVINCGYIAHAALGAAIGQWQRGGAAAAAAQLAMGAAAAATVALPVAGFQLHGYLAFCCPEPPPGCRPARPGSLDALLQPLRSWATGGGLCTAACSTGAGHEQHSTAAATPEDVSASGQGDAGAGSEGARGLLTDLDPSVQLAPSSDDRNNPICSKDQGGCEILSPADGRPRPWCSRRPPCIYAFVQERYWGVGALRYWRPHQLPNFLLAAPALLAAAAGCCAYAAANPRLLLTGGWQHLTPARRPPATHGFLSPAVAVHIYPWAFMALYALLFMHVQVATRFLSSCPAHYWFLAHLTDPQRAGRLDADSSCMAGPGSGQAAAAPSREAGCSGTEAAGGQATQRRQRGPGHVWKLAVWGCCLGYTVVGSVMLPNFYPWT